MAVADVDGVDELLVLLVNVFDPAALTGLGQADEVEQLQVLHHLAEADAAGVRAHLDCKHRSGLLDSTFAAWRCQLVGLLASVNGPHLPACRP